MGAHDGHRLLGLHLDLALGAVLAGGAFAGLVLALARALVAAAGLAARGVVAATVLVRGLERLCALRVTGDPGFRVWGLEFGFRV
jgi:hypothetical protein